jgi:tRNA(adenine34) deaminase
MPIGAVLACDGEALAEAHWRGISHGLLNHPEHVVLVAADMRVQLEQRRRCKLYTTLEPCLMCMGTAMSFCVGRIVYALAAPADGAADVAAQWKPQQGHPASDIPLLVARDRPGCRGRRRSLANREVARHGRRRRRG